MSQLPAALINEACLDLQKDRKDEIAAGCAFLDRTLTRGFAASVLVRCRRGRLRVAIARLT